MVENPTANIEITINDNLENNTIFDSINNIIENYKEKIQDGAEKGLNELAEQVATEQQNSISSGGHIVTGELYNSITANVNGLSATIGSTLNGYSPSVIEYGRGEVYPVTASCLHFVSDGKEYFVKSVSAYEGDPYVAPSIEYAKSQAKEIILSNIF